MAASGVVESCGLIVPPAEAGACQEGGSTTCGAVGTIEESGRLMGLGLVPPVGPPLAAGPPGSSVHGILQARILEWVAMPSSRGVSASQVLMGKQITQGSTYILSQQVWGET